jgi:hypothetical protein
MRDAVVKVKGRRLQWIVGPDPKWRVIRAFVMRLEEAKIQGR